MSIFSILVLALAVLSCVCKVPLLANAHQSISYPYPVSRDLSCRIGLGKNCARPCPKKDLRLDVNPDNPSISTRRGGWITVNVFANNHRGGFNRWTLVNVRDMDNKDKHRENAFLFTCADVGVAKCSRRFMKRDCRFDRRKEYYIHRIKIPMNIPDGVYVLGWVWYGGGEKWGTFSDYYDCTFIKIQGGRTEKLHLPQFKPGRSVTGRNGLCRSSVNEIGICWRRPCPGGPRRSTLQKPFEFTNKVPEAISDEVYIDPYRLKPRSRNSAYIVSITIRSADNPSRIFTTSKRTSTPYIRLTRKMRPTITAETSGKVRSVTFYTDGKKGYTDTKKPYAIVTNWIDKQKVARYNVWNYKGVRKVLTISAKAVGWDGSVHWRTIELSTDL